MKTRVTLSFAACTLAFLTTSATSADAQERRTSRAENCVIVLDELHPGEKSSRVLAQRCSTDPKDLTAGALGLDPGSQALDSPLMTWYKDSRYRGQNTTVYGNSGTCDREGYAFGVIPWEWNDAISSFKVHGLCYSTRVWVDGKFSGANHLFVGNVSNVGSAWNDRISSLKVWAS